jgi:hypothetical protein
MDNIIYSVNIKFGTWIFVKMTLLMSDVKLIKIKHFQKKKNCGRDVLVSTNMNRLKKHKVLEQNKLKN